VNHHPSHVCLDCGSMVSSTHEATQRHYRWHEDFAEMQASWAALEEAATVVVPEDDRP